MLWFNMLRMAQGLLYNKFKGGIGMAARIKSLDVDLQLGNNGVEIEVRTTDDSKQLGDLYVTRSGVIWCQGKTTRANGVKKCWDEVIQLFEENA